MIKCLIEFFKNVPTVYVRNGVVLIPFDVTYKEQK